MKRFIILLKRFIPPYKKYVGLNVLFNLLSTIFSLFSFALIIPILEILFNTKAVVYELQSTHNVPMSELFDVLKNNLYYYTTELIDKSGALTVLIILSSFLILMTFLKVATAYLGSFFMVSIRTGVLRDLRNMIFAKIVHLPIGFFNEERKGDIMSRMTLDVNEVEASIMSSLDMLFKNPLMILTYIIVMFTISWELTLFVMVLLTISGYFIGQVGKSLKRKSLEGSILTGELTSQIEETLGGLRIIKAFNAEKKIISRFVALNNRLRGTLNKIQGRYLLAHPMSEFMGTVVIATVLCYGGNLILTSNSEALTASVFIYYILIFYSIINPVKELSKAAYSVQKGMASLERIDKILHTQNSLHTVNGKEISGFNHSIEFKNVSFKYQKAWVLRNINLTIEKGKTIALVGQSGSGKSTLVDLIPRFWDVVEGEICIDGVNIKEINLHSLRDLMGNVNQEAILFNDTFYNNIAFGVENATMDEVIAAAKIANAHDFISATEQGYDSNIGDRGSKLSGGQRQRISIARAILKNPPILILDEATSALDTESEKLVQEAIEKLMKNRTSVVIAHRLSTIKNADEICVLLDGKIVERGTHEALLQENGVYKKLQETQIV